MGIRVYYTPYTAAFLSTAFLMGISADIKQKSAYDIIFPAREYTPRVRYMQASLLARKTD